LKYISFARESSIGKEAWRTYNGHVPPWGGRRASADGRNADKESSSVRSGMPRQLLRE